MNTNTNNTNTNTNTNVPRDIMIKNLDLSIPKVSNNVNLHRDIMMKNLDLHIPKISANTTEKHIADALWYMRIATVEYVDIVAIKDPETKIVKHYSAFLRLRSWGPEYFPAAEFNERKTFKILLGGYANDPYEKYWVLYPNTNPLPRSKVNTHQLAASTEKLFEINEQLVAKIAMMEDKFALMEKQNLFEINERLVAKIAMMENKYDVMKKQMGIMEERLTRLSYVEPTPEEISEMMQIPKLTRYPSETQKYKSYDALLADGSLHQIKQNQGVLVIDEDDCMFSKRLAPFDEDLITDAQVKTVQIPKQDPVDEEEVKVIIASNGRAVCSRDFCGNI
jgi:hypothetical protein